MAIADWEKLYREYVEVKPDDAMSDQDKIMCLEDLCPDDVQKYLAKLIAYGSLKNDNYEAYKLAIDQY